MPKDKKLKQNEVNPLSYHLELCMVEFNFNLYKYRYDINMTFNKKKN